MYGTITTWGGKLLIDLDLSNSTAAKKYLGGVKPSFSHDIFGDLSAGYGYLDSNGFWQYPLHVSYLN